jgi:hypothetical protein
MLTMNKTFVLLNNRLSSIEDKQMSCYINAKLWILTHWSVTFIIELIFLYIYLILWCICLVSFLYNPDWYRTVRNILQSYYLRPYEEEELIFLYSIGVLIKEITLIFVYVFFAFMYRCFGLVHDKSIITSMNFYQWLVEASYIPFVLSTTYYVGTIENFVRLYRSFSLVAIMIKIPVFVLMCCAESDNYFFLNDLKAYFFKYIM